MPQDKTLQNKVTILERQVKELLEWKKQRERQQIKYPLDIESMKALNEAMSSFIFTRVNLLDAYFSPQLTSPTTRGQMRYFDDLTTQNFRVRTSTNPPDAADFTGTIDLTAV